LNFSGKSFGLSRCVVPISLLDKEIAAIVLDLWYLKGLFMELRSSVDSDFGLHTSILPVEFLGLGSLDGNWNDFLHSLEPSFSDSFSWRIRSSCLLEPKSGR